MNSNMEAQTAEIVATLAKAGSTGIAIIIVVYMYLKDKMLAGERQSFITAVQDFTELAGRMHEANNQNKAVIEENTRVIKENTKVLTEILIKAQK